MKRMNICRNNERQGIVCQSALGWHWVVTSGRMAGRADDADSYREAKLTLRRTWRKGMRIRIGGRELIA